MVKIDFRLVEAQKPDFLYQRFMEYITSQGFTDVTVINHGGYEPAKTPADNPFITKIIDTANQVYNRTPVIWPTAPGTSPIYVIKNWLNIPVASAGGVDYPGSNIHAPNENIRVKDYIKSIEYLATLICTYQKPQ
jgi:acetylornithine deacetylase/succinyl-diaminopimelate desuccinylase-like protein